MPVKISVNGTKYATRPIDWKKKSDTKLPLKPRKFFISLSLGKIKFGSSGEYVIRAINNNSPNPKIMSPKISISLLKVKPNTLLNKFFILIIDESN